jgi:chitinase
MNSETTLFDWIRKCVILVPILIVLTAPVVPAASVTIRWDPNHPAPDGYRVFARKIDQAYDFSRPDWEGATASCTLHHLEGQYEYFFVIRAYDGALESSNSDEAHYVPPLTDNDDDGVTDDWETRFGLNPGSDDAGRDPDQDGISNRDEFRAGLNPNDPGVGTAPLTPKPLFPESYNLVERNPLLDAGDFSDADGDAHIATQWQVHDSVSGDCLLDVVSDRWLNLLRVPLLLLNEDETYQWRVRFFDSGGRASAWSARAYFTTQAADNDLNGNGIEDDQEGGAIQAHVTRSISSPIINCEPMDLAVASEDTVEAIEQMALIDPADLEIDETTPDRLPSAMLAYKLVLYQLGERALVTIHLTDPAPAGAKWIKYDAVNGWRDYSHHAAISADRLSVTVEVKDGGFGDADGVANGIIIDPAGLSTPPTVSTVGGGSAGRGRHICFIDAINNTSMTVRGPWQWAMVHMRRLLTNE